MRRCRSTTRTFASRTSAVPASCSAGSPRCRSRTVSGGCSRRWGGNRLRSSLLLIAAILLVAPLAASARPAAPAANGMLKGIYDEHQVLYGDPDRVFETLEQLRTKVIRAQLIWGGRRGVAKRKPERPTDPADPAYDW